MRDAFRKPKRFRGLIAMLYRVIADVLVFIHLAFVGIVIFGGLLVKRWPRVAWIHVPCVLWGALVEFAGWICPLTPLENHFRDLGGEMGCSGGFVEHYLLPLIYPHGLTRTVQVLLGILVIVLNGAIYGYLIARRRSGVEAVKFSLRMQLTGRIIID